MKYIIIISFLAILLSCTSSRYILVSHDKLKQDISTYGSLPAKRYLIVPNEYSSESMPFLQNEPSRAVIDFLKRNQLKKAKKHLNLKPYEDKNSLYFASALIYLYESKFDSCNFYIREMSDYSKNCFFQFIKVDCEYEKDRISGNIDYKTYLSKYQNVLDCSSEDELHKELVKTRLKLIRYGY